MKKPKNSFSQYFGFRRHCLSLWEGSLVPGRRWSTTPHLELIHRSHVTACYASNVFRVIGEEGEVRWRSSTDPRGTQLGGLSPAESAVNHVFWKSQIKIVSSPHIIPGAAKPSSVDRRRIQNRSCPNAS